VAKGKEEKGQGMRMKKNWENLGISLVLCKQGGGGV
jgi:hypothetical protein